MKRSIQVDDLFAISTIAQPVIAPNGKEAVFVRTQISEAANAYHSALFHLNMETNEISQWTYCEEVISNVAWSPDGTQLAFLSNRTKKNQLYILNRSGGEARKITNFMCGVSNFKWDTSNTSIWFSAAVEKGLTFTDDKAKIDAKKPQPYVVERMRYKLDGLGLAPQNCHLQVGKIDLKNKQITQVTGDENDYVLLDVSHNGQFILLTHNAPYADGTFTSIIRLIDLKTGKNTIVSELFSALKEATFSLDDAYIAIVGEQYDSYRNAKHPTLYAYELASNMMWPLTEMLDAPVGDCAISDIHTSVERVVQWTTTNDLYFRLSTNGDVRLYYATLGGAIYPASPEDEHVFAFHVAPNDDTVLMGISQQTLIGELFEASISMGTRTQVTFFNEPLQQQIEWSKPEVVSYQAADGQLVFGWLLKPAHFNEGGKYPLVLNIHGGPHLMFANTFFHELQLLAAQGYGVLYINPHGSHSYSQQFANAVRGKYGEVDYEDFMRMLDVVIEENTWVDEARLGVLGGSYGGFMTNWIVTQTDRFKAAVTQRSISNWISFYGVSDIGYYLTEWQLFATMKNPDDLWQRSPLKYVGNVRTPVLILHSEDDLRCPIEQAEQFFIALKANGVDTKFVRFPKANHNLSRTGLPNLRKHRLQQIIQWFMTKL